MDKFTGPDKNEEKIKDVVDHTLYLVLYIYKEIFNPMDFWCTQNLKDTPTQNSWQSQKDK